ncbi:ABC transporter permease [Priestia filamentosa]|uniref:ABC3 transporter permease C-terminal domain-containing protein n=1 Tax=Priestia filamentosa TaxID=1402861 RepID=A0A1X7G238_9BACI|nr:FtsX-like permease family protein [Priestia filamentosa]AKO92127.1 hypothetical protein BEH_08455 [Priestia filamentosa]OXS65882.1 hypothetical protein B1B01_20760 [Priestia filamentosa]RJS64585.1 ABC transporter permease [Priestia filamentosa]WRU96628.1 FtsX-like permease family protein [Priestia filamentosa]SMF62569.1 putative ABC transport system permease protein [Priestia filamentosa]
MLIHQMLTKKYLLHHKKRTLLTLLGIILSIALITSIGTFLISYQQYSLEKTRIEYGSYHIKIEHVNIQDAKRLQANPQVKKVGLSSQQTLFFNDNSKFKLKSIDMQAYSMLPFHTIHKQKKNGLIMEEWAAAKYKKDGNIKKTVNLMDASGLEHSFYIQEIVENNQSLREDQDLQAFNVHKTIQKTNDMEVYVKLDPQANFHEVYNQVLTYIPKKNVELNYQLIDLEYWNNTGDGNGNAFKSVIYILPTVIVVIATIAFIFNTFQISVVERLRHIGLLKTVGATKRQIQKMIVYEMALLGVIGIPIGLLLGILGFWAILSAYQFIFEENELSLFYFKIILSPTVFILSSLIGLLSLIISGLIPLKIASRISPLATIKTPINRNTFKIKKINTFMQKWINIETVMAIRNIRRNKLRSLTIIFSLSFSVFLFITFSIFSTELLDMELKEKTDGEFQLNFYEPERLPTSLWRDLENISEVQEKYIHYESSPAQMLLPSMASDKMKVQGNQVVNLDGKSFSSINLTITSLTDENKTFLMKKLIDGSLNKKKLIQEQGVIYIQANNSKSSVQVGDEVYVRLQTNDTDRLNDVKKVKISGIVKLNQFENKIMAYPEVLSFINNQKVNRISLFLNSNNNEKKVEKSLNKLAVQYPNIDIVNELKIQRNLSSLYLQVQILLYGFLIVIGFIAVLNIFNTTFMNIILRKSEYATLQAIGMSIKSMRRMITAEGILYGIISVMIGSTVAKVVGFLLFLSSGTPQGTGHLKLYITSWFGILIICYISARVSSRILKKIQWKDTLRNE